MCVCMCVCISKRCISVYLQKVFFIKINVYYKKNFLLKETKLQFHIFYTTNSFKHSLDFKQTIGQFKLVMSKLFPNNQVKLVYFLSNTNQLIAHCLIIYDPQFDSYDLYPMVLSVTS